VGGRPSLLRLLLAVVTTAALVTAVWLAVLGRRESHRASDDRHANAAAIAHNRSLSSQLSKLTATNERAGARVAVIDGDRRSTATGMDSVVRAWNAWLDANNALIETANGFVDTSVPSGPAVRTALDPRMRTVADKEAAFRAAVVRFAAASAKARHDLGGTKP
jgi:hypothetical protein